MVRALACHARGRGFESRHSRHFSPPKYDCERRRHACLRTCVSMLKPWLKLGFGIASADEVGQATA